MAGGAWIRIPGGLTRRWPGGVAISVAEDIDLSGGDRVAILGPSGSGKTTLLRLLGLLDRHTLGTIGYRLPDCPPVSWHRNTPGRRARPLRDAFGFVFQDARLLPYLTVLENILALPRLRGAGRVELAGRRMEILEAMAAARLGASLPMPSAKGRGLFSRRVSSLQNPLADAFPAALSGGERRRVALLRALSADPGLLLADEPTSGVDRETGEIVMGTLMQWAKGQRKPRLLLFVTHSAREALSHADR